MEDEPRSGSARASGTSRMAQWGRRLETTKVGPATVAIFIAVLGVFCAVAAGIGYVMHHLPMR